MTESGFPQAWADLRAALPEGATVAFLERTADQYEMWAKDGSTTLGFAYGPTLTETAQRLKVLVLHAAEES